MSRKIKKNEQWILDMCEGTDYTAYDCPTDGLYAVNGSVDDKTCPYCKKECDRYE